MTLRWIGTALLCLGAVNVLLGTMLAFRSASNDIWAYVVVVSGVVVMICGYFIGKRKCRK
jgi:hypothetical protein